MEEIRKIYEFKTHADYYNYLDDLTDQGFQGLPCMLFPSPEHVNCKWMLDVENKKFVPILEDGKHFMSDDSE